MRRDQRRIRARARRCTALAIAAGLLALEGCKLSTPATTASLPGVAFYEKPRATPAPPWPDTMRIERVSAERLREYVDRLQFDSSHRVGDEQRLMVVETTTPRHGPLARIEPEIGAAAIPRDSLRRGRIIARITIVAPDRQLGYTYPKLGIEDTVSYIWVQRPDDNAANDRAYMLGRNGRIRRLDLAVSRHPRRAEFVATVRWLWSEDDEGTWGDCGADCCKVTRSLN